MSTIHRRTFVFPFQLLGGLLVVSAGVRVASAGPYAPAAGEPGSTAIPRDSPTFVGWATGWENYRPGSEVAPEWQTPAMGLGPAEGTSVDIVSLGRGGEITLTFDAPILDAAGSDFAIFENSFNDTFLELAWVEVSSNGADFVRFENDSLTPEATGPFGAVDPTNLIGLAGKYRQGFGTPFDLAEAGLGFATHVRLLDIVGDGSAMDSSGDPIFEPYPSTGAAGFDLDGIGVIHAVPEPASAMFFTAACVLTLRQRRLLRFT